MGFISWLDSDQKNHPKASHILGTYIIIYSVKKTKLEFTGCYTGNALSFFIVVLGGDI
jgi:hypothetical protein